MASPTLQQLEDSAAATVASFCVHAREWIRGGEGLGSDQSWRLRDVVMRPLLHEFEWAQSLAKDCAILEEKALWSKVHVVHRPEGQGAGMSQDGNGQWWHWRCQAVVLHDGYLLPIDICCTLTTCAPRSIKTRVSLYDDASLFGESWSAFIASDSLANVQARYACRPGLYKRPATVLRQLVARPVRSEEDSLQIVVKHNARHYFNEEPSPFYVLASVELVPDVWYDLVQPIGTSIERVYWIGHTSPVYSQVQRSLIWWHRSEHLRQDAHTLPDATALLQSFAEDDSVVRAWKSQHLVSMLESESDASDRESEARDSDTDDTDGL